MIVMDLPTIGAPDGLTPGELERWRGAVDLGRRAAGGDTTALAELEKSEGGGVLDDRGVLLYVDQMMFGAMVGTHPTYLRRLRADGRLIQPDVSVGRVWGWGPGRAVMWAIEYGYLTPDCEKITSRTGRAVALSAGLALEHRPHWRRDVVAYLTQNAAGEFLGITGDSVYQARMREAGPVEAIRIGAICGWSLERLRAYNLKRPPQMRALSKEPGAVSA